MTDHPTPDDLARLDDRARAAASDLREHVLTHLDVDASLAGLPMRHRTPPWARITAVAAVAALLVGTVAVLAQRAPGDGTRLDVDQALPDVEVGVLRPLGPHDGKDSIQLPVTAEPRTELRDGDVVTVTGEGFVPGETVGLVQCAREAGGETAATRGGVDGCYIGDYQSITADDQGVASGTYAVHRVLTTPLTGTVDCAAEAERCILAMGALNDYDRSGGSAIAFAAGLEPVTLPTVQALPTEALADGDLVHVTADGLTPDTTMFVEVCSSDPSACWQTGEALDPATDGMDGYPEVGLLVDGSGHAEGDVPVWRYLPGPEPSTYVDCAVSPCSLRLSGDVAPPTVPLHFTPGGDGPAAPALSAAPTNGLAPGERISVQGTGFLPGSQVSLSLCAAFSAMLVEGYPVCLGSEDGDLVPVGADGTFVTDLDVPDPGTMPSMASEECSADGACHTVEAPGGGEPIRCDDATTSCALTVYYVVETPDGTLTQPPRFQPAPVPITFR